MVYIGPHAVTPIFQEPLPTVDTEYEKNENGYISFSCVVSGQPLPNITWVKDGSQLVLREGQQVNEVQVEDTAVNSTLFLSLLSEVDSGEYWCKAENTLGETEMQMVFALNVFDESKKFCLMHQAKLSASLTLHRKS